LFKRECFCGCGDQIPRLPLGLRSVNDLGKDVTERLAYTRAILGDLVGHPTFATWDADGEEHVKTLQNALHYFIHDDMQELRNDPDTFPPQIDRPELHRWMSTGRDVERSLIQLGAPPIKEWLRMPEETRESEELANLREAIARDYSHTERDGHTELVPLRNRKEPQRLLTAKERRKQRILEIPSLKRTGADDLAEPLPEVKFAIDRLHVDGGNVVLVAKKNTGKTHFVMNLQRALTDDEPFLGEFKAKPLNGTIAFFNYELTPSRRREWMRDMNFKHPERLVPPFDVRGYRAPFWDDEYRKHLVEYFAAKGVEWWIIDTAMRAGSGFVTNWDSDDEVDAFCSLLDEIKIEAGITNVVLTHHLGHQELGKDEVHARGASRLESWGDSLWYLTKVSGGHSFEVVGRDVELEAIDLSARRGRTFYYTGVTRGERLQEEGVRIVCETLAAMLNEGSVRPPTNQLEKRIQLENQTLRTVNERFKWIRAAEEGRYIERTKNGTALVCDLTERGWRVTRAGAPDASGGRAERATDPAPEEG